MLKMNLAGLMRQRGIPNPAHFLVKHGFTYHTANRLLRNAQDSVSNKKLEKLCLLLNCTIDDLYEWQKPSDTFIPENHPLHKLLPKAGEVDMLQKMQELPMEKLAQLKEFMKDL
jgi:DNA-binding Xre family transcriptional regulator